MMAVDNDCFEYNTDEGDDGDSVDDDNNNSFYCDKMIDFWW